MAELLQKNEDDPSVMKYCTFIEEMWKFGDDAAVNIVDVTILEELSDDLVVWGKLRSCFSPEFVDYVNTDLLPNNVLMRHVPKL